MKKIISFVFALLLVTSGIMAQQNNGLPGVPQTESYVVTPIDTTSGVIVRKVSFLRSNSIVLVGNLFLPKDFDSKKRYPAVLSIHPAGSVKVSRAVCLPFGGTKVGPAIKKLTEFFKRTLS